MAEDDTVLIRLSAGTVRALRRLASVWEPLVAFGRNPLKFVWGLLATIIVTGFLNVGSVIVGTVDFIGQSLAAVPALAGNSLRVFAPVETQLLAISEAVAFRIGEVLAAAGPAAPILVFAFAAVVAVVLYQVTVALIGELPVGSSLVDILGLR